MIDLHENVTMLNSIQELKDLIKSKEVELPKVDRSVRVEGFSLYWLKGLRIRSMKDRLLEIERNLGLKPTYPNGGGY